VVQRLVQYYDKLSDRDLAQEARRLEHRDPAVMDSLTPYRVQALDQVRQARQQPRAAAPPDVPAPPAAATHQAVLRHYQALYKDFSTPQLLEEQRRLQGSLTGPVKALTQDVRTSLRLSALQQLLTQRQAGTPARTPATDEEP
jgi:hypothetical protein